MREVNILIESGYIWGAGMPEEKSDEFEKDLERILTNIGFKFHPSNFGSAATASRGDEGLYLHPMQITGRIKEENWGELIGSLKTGRTFKITKQEIGDEVCMLSDEDYEKYVLEPLSREIIKTLSMNKNLIKHEGIMDFAMRAARQFGRKRPYDHWGVDIPGTSSLQQEVQYVISLWEKVN